MSSLPAGELEATACTLSKHPAASHKVTQFIDFLTSSERPSIHPECYDVAPHTIGCSTTGLGHQNLGSTGATPGCPDLCRDTASCTHSIFSFNTYNCYLYSYVGCTQGGDWRFLFTDSACRFAASFCYHQTLIHGAYTGTPIGALIPVNAETECAVRCDAAASCVAYIMDTGTPMRCELLSDIHTSNWLYNPRRLISIKSPSCSTDEGSQSPPVSPALRMMAVHFQCASRCTTMAI